MWYDYKPERTQDGLKNNKTIYLPFFRLYYSHEWEQLKVNPINIFYKNERLRKFSSRS